MTTITELTDDALAVLKAAGKDVVGFALSEGQKLVAEAKQSNLGTLALNLIQIMENHTMSGVSKMSAVVGALIPAVQEFIAGGGLKGLLTSVLSFALEFAQSVYNDFKADIAQVAARAQAAA